MTTLGNQSGSQRRVSWLAVVLFVCVAAVGVALILYASGIGTGFVYDDV